MATLGVVEFFIFLAHKYYKDLNIAEELIFAQVHFTLFYTALINAFQSVILAFFVIRNSDRLWEQTEYQDLHHYVEIREEFERIDRELYWKYYKAMEVKDSVTLSSRSINKLRVDAEAAQEFEFSLSGLKRFGKDMYETLQHPIRSRKHNALLIQIRFHELKFHFIKAHDLPITFNVSQYLKRSELHVLTKLVHISTFAWLLLTGAVALVYFLMGVTVFITDGDNRTVGLALTWVFFVVNIIFVLISLLLYNKMKRIFRYIMHMKLISNDTSIRFNSTNRRSSATDVPDGLAQNQLFWGGSPKYITICIQFMQFGFAVFLAIILIFWETINSDGLDTYLLLIALLIAYSSFVAIMAHVIPRFTMCSSLGQLVNHQRLHESLARHRLEEAQRKRKQQLDHSEMYDPADWKDHIDEITDDSSETGMKGLGQLLGFTNSKTYPYSQTNSRSNLMWELTQLDTKDLRKNLPKVSQATLEERDKEIMERRNSRRSLSDGVASMRMMKMFSHGDETPGTIVSTASRCTDDSSVPDSSADSRKLRRKGERLRSASASASIQMMRDYTQDEDIMKEKGEKLATESPMSKRNRQRTVSPQADITMMRNAPMDFSSCESTSPSSYPTKKSFSHPDLQCITEGNGLSNESLAITNTPQIADVFEATTTLPHYLHGDVDSELILFDAKVGDNSSMHGRESVITEDEESDDEDIPNVDEVQRGLAKAQPEPKQKVLDYVVSYFRSRQYKIVSAVFGTLPCFFMVGMRLEDMLLVTGISTDNRNTFGFPLGVSYWIEVSLQSCFILAACANIFMFRPGQIHFDKDPTVFASALIDFCICSMCLVLLMVAESQRCCNNHERLLAAEDYSKTPVACCPEWGTRAYGGFGNIEPFTSLITLRLFRFYIAKITLSYWDSISGRSTSALADSGNNSTELNDANRNVLDPLFDKKKHHDEHHNKLNFDNEKGTIVELWQVAIGLYPEIVKKHGEFSSELFQAMLGIEILESVLATGPNCPPEEVQREPSSKFPQITEPLPPLDRPKPPVYRSVTSGSQSIRSSPMANRRRALSTDARYAGLAPEAQAIILAGKVGQNVSCRNLMDTNKFGGRFKNRGDFSDFGSSWTENHMTTTGMSLLRLPEFEVITEETTEDTILLSQFIAPNSRLLRSMRRCDKKLLPLFNTWTPVDVVMTKYEIIYFDVAEIDDIDSFESPSPVYARMQSIREAIIATKGGKGLRLRDVAFGRRIIGRQELSTVESVHVTRVLPHNGKFPENDANRSSCLADEFWKPKAPTTHCNVDSDALLKESRNKRWAHLKEDRLKIKMKHDTLYLRYYSDLENMEHHVDRVLSENEAEGTIFKNNAYQWCQTIARICGSEQLTQKMPHFGDDDSEELRDYLVIVDSNGLDASKQKKGVAFRMGMLRKPKAPTAFAHNCADGDGDEDEEGQEATDTALRKVAFRRVMSFGEAPTTSNGRNSRLKSLLRRGSSNDNETNQNPEGEISTKHFHRRHHTLSADFHAEEDE